MARREGRRLRLPLCASVASAACCCWHSSRRSDCTFAAAELPLQARGPPGGEHRSAPSRLQTAPCLAGQAGKERGAGPAGRQPLAILAAAFCGLATGRLSSYGRRGARRWPPARTAARGKKGGGAAEKGVNYSDTVLLPKTAFSQRANAKTREPEIQEFWRSERIYEKLLERPASKGTFSLHDGPPYANGSLHMGHALNKILKDCINKFKAVQGYRVKYIPGWDCHGLPIELKVLQSLKSKARRELTPIKLRQAAAKFARQTVAEQRKSFERYGVWGDFETPYLTLLPQYEAAQLGIFEEMVRGGHIYRGRKPVYWSPSTRTALAEAELEYPEGHISPSIYAAFKCVDVPAAITEAVGSAEGLEVAVWTTTPWTIPANRAVAVNPELEYAVVRAEWPEGRTRRLVVASGLVESLQALLGVPMSREAELKGGLLEGLRYEHPLSGDSAPVVLGGDYITTESGTGLVHTAPGHGADDFNVGQKYGLEVAAPVDDKGSFTEGVGVESLVGANVLTDANARVTELLRTSGSLLLERPYEHKYPYDWRSKKPVITRATPQWFASIDGLRNGVLQAMDEVQFIPESYANRMRPMIVGRSDWCISRQRSWGVPIPAFYRKDSGEALLTPEVVSHVKGIVAERGSDAWWELPIEELLPDEFKHEADLYERGTDTMDVWFDSGSSWAAVQEEIGHPVDLYLEGQDQHRGWFQSSLITSVAVRGHAPYKSVMTHGFCVDENGRKMSKSVGNVIDPTTIIEGGSDQKKNPAFGADVLRMWVASVDFTFDVAISQSIMASVAENVRKIRNRVRFMLGNICDFDPATDSVPYAELPLLDRHIIHQAQETFAQMEQAYGAYAFSRASRVLTEFMQELSAFYLDAAKDRLYITARSSPRRRSCQTVLRWLAENLARAMAPVLCHLAEDVWQALPGPSAEPSVFLAGWCAPFPGGAERGPGPPLRALREVLGLRDATHAALERARQAGLIGSALEAHVTVYLEPSSSLKESIDELGTSSHPDVDGLRWLLGVSGADVSLEASAADGEAMAVQAEALGATVGVRPAAGVKCERCWGYCESVGSRQAHPHICERCAHVVEALSAPA